VKKVTGYQYELSLVVDGVFNDCLEGAGVVPEALFKAVLRIAQVQVAGVDEVHWELMDVRVKNDYGGGVKVLTGQFKFCPYISDLDKMSDVKSLLL
jgi:methyl coenzyme M reductase subunit C-like uncharacterized protein (methanogenesis marker protein 7)